MSSTNSNVYQDVTYDQPWTTHDGTGFTKTGYTLSHWTTVNGGSGTRYELNESHDAFTAVNDGQLTLYTNWKANTYEVKYNGNGATSGSMENSSHTYNVAKNLTKNTYVKTGHEF